MKFWLVGKDLPHCAGARVQVYGNLLNAVWMAYDLSALFDSASPRALSPA